jgi:hypothetical protein
MQAKLQTSVSYSTLDMCLNVNSKPVIEARNLGYILVSSQSGIKECHDIAETVLKLALNTKQSIRIKIKWTYNLNRILYCA